MYKRNRKVKRRVVEKEIICELVRTVRSYLPRSGTRKMYEILKVMMESHGVSIGRDRLFVVLRESQMLVRRRKRHFITTNSKHQFYKYPNRAKGLKLERPEQLWVSDITYIKCQRSHLFLSLVTDAYSRKIMGYHVADHLKTSGPAEALKMALKNRKYPDRQLMHHSDRGIQYCSSEYTSILLGHGIEISMTESYDPYENAKAERVNGTIKNEFELDKPFYSITNARREVGKTVEIYNKLRPHLSCGMRTPEQVHEKPKLYPGKLQTNPLWETIILNNFNNN